MQGDYKLIWYLGYPGYNDVRELYDLKDDTQELRDLSKSQPEMVRAMRTELHAKLAGADKPFRDRA